MDTRQRNLGNAARLFQLYRSPAAEPGPSSDAERYD